MVLSNRGTKEYYTWNTTFGLTSLDIPAVTRNVKLINRLKVSYHMGIGVNG